MAFHSTQTDGLFGLLALATTLMPGIASVLGVGFVLGLKHALDADHLVAMSTIVSNRKGLLSASAVGAFWGFGHTASLLIVGMLVIALHIQIPDIVALGLEFCVAAMLVGLGVRVLWKLWQGGTLHLHVHEHGGTKHTHPHVHAHKEFHNGEHHNQTHTHDPWLANRLQVVIKAMLPSPSVRLRSILIGMVHGLAGSATLMLLVLATIPSPLLGLTYICIFGIGSVGGMLIMSTLIGIPFVVSANKSEALNMAVRWLSGLLSVGFGLFLAWQIGFVGGLFS